MQIPGCLVIEDCVPGVRAAYSAGMRIFGFSGKNHCFFSHGPRLVDARTNPVGALKAYVGS